ncbi:MAG: PRC-barrel domain-containing protein [Gemmatimonadaceae bacterium]|nr:PRC-barrel domain-containing protein [Gemmatimonadaceae bacterium]
MGHSLDPLDERNNMRTEGLGDARSEMSHARGASESDNAGLRALSDVDDLGIVDGEPDIRGWKVQGINGEHVGKVDDLIIDMAEMKVRYMAVKLDKDTFSLDDSHSVLVPIGTARLIDDDDLVVIRASTSELAAMPAYDDDMFDDESSLHEQYGRPFMTGTGTDALMQEHTSTSSSSSTRENMYRGDHFNDSALRRQDNDDASYLRRHEQSSRGSMEQASAGDAVTAHPVAPRGEPVRHDRAVEDREVIDADVRRERIDTDDDTQTRRTRGTDTGDELR